MPSVVLSLSLSFPFQFLLFQRIRAHVEAGEIYCPPEIAVVLCSYAAQALYGNYSPSLHKPNFLVDDPILPLK